MPVSNRNINKVKQAKFQSSIRPEVSESVFARWMERITTLLLRRRIVTSPYSGRRNWEHPGEGKAHVRFPLETWPFGPRKRRAKRKTAAHMCGCMTVQLRRKQLICTYIHTRTYLCRHRIGYWPHCTSMNKIIVCLCMQRVSSWMPFIKHHTNVTQDKWLYLCHISLDKCK